MQDMSAKLLKAKQAQELPASNQEINQLRQQYFCYEKRGNEYVYPIGYKWVSVFVFCWMTQCTWSVETKSVCVKVPYYYFVVQYILDPKAVHICTRVAKTRRVLRATRTHQNVNFVYITYTSQPYLRAGRLAKISCLSAVRNWSFGHTLSWAPELLHSYSTHMHFDHQLKVDQCHI